MEKKNLSPTFGKKSMTVIVLLLLLIACPMGARNVITLRSQMSHHGEYAWKMHRASGLSEAPEKLSLADYDDSQWQGAIVPGTVLTSMVANGEYPDPYYGTNNKLSEHKIPDISVAGRDFYTYWFRTSFTLPQSMKGQRIWLQPQGVNYRAEFWLNGNLVLTTKGMFLQSDVDITDYVKIGERNALAILVFPVDMPGTCKPKDWGSKGEYRNGGNGDIGLNTTQLMTTGWDFTYPDGIRDRNTGIWRDINIYSTGAVALRNPFIKSRLEHPDYDKAYETVTVEVVNPSISNQPVDCLIKGEIEGTGITFSKTVSLPRGGHQTVTFLPTDFQQLIIDHPRLWWPINKGPQNLYRLKLTASVEGLECDSLSTRFGIREVVTTQETPDSSKLFIINGHKTFIRGSNWLPEAMQRTDEERMRTELRYTHQSGINLLRLWGGGIAESDLFYDLCDEYGILIWQEFWMTGDTRHPQDEDCYFNNVESTVKRLRNHPSLAFYVASNEGSEVSGTHELLERVDGTRPFQIQSECDGVHDGSPYKQVNPMRHYANEASERGSRVDGFNPEYGAPTLPLVETLRQMMPQEDLWPINKAAWDYLDGNGFHLMTTLYDAMIRQYGEPKSIEDYARKGQLVGAINSKSIWEVWNYNKLGYGDRFCSGLLFWYHNCPNPQVCARMWDWTLRPTASLYHTMHSLEPLHVQFDYLKNTVSVANDYLQAYPHCQVIAQVYDFNSQKCWEKSVQTDVAADGVANDVMKIDFPKDITKMHFINLVLKDAKGNVVSENFYWRSTDSYQGKNTVTGPCTSGFEDIDKLPSATLQISKKVELKEGVYRVSLKVKNTSSHIALFNQIQLQDAQGTVIVPAFCSDNFFSLLPHAEKTVTIEVDVKTQKDLPQIKVTPYNSPQA
jgi:mannosylglycoprotein endo-beta-mannosidase